MEDTTDYHGFGWPWPTSIQYNSPSANPIITLPVHSGDCNNNVGGDHIGDHFGDDVGDHVGDHNDHIGDSVVVVEQIRENCKSDIQQLQQFNLWLESIAKLKTDFNDISSRIQQVEASAVTFQYQASAPACSYRNGYGDSLSYFHSGAAASTLEQIRQAVVVLNETMALNVNQSGQTKNDVNEIKAELNDMRAEWNDTKEKIAQRMDLIEQRMDLIEQRMKETSDSLGEVIEWLGDVHTLLTE